MLVSLEEFLARVKARRLELERKVRMPDASEVLHAEYEEISRQEEELERRAWDLRRFVAGWCPWPPPKPD